MKLTTCPSCGSVDLGQAFDKFSGIVFVCNTCGYKGQAASETQIEKK